MTARKPKRLIDDPPSGLRERLRADGSVRIWWEPPAEARAKGARNIELDANRLTWSIREARRFTRDALKAPRHRAVGITVNHAIDDYEASRDFKRKRPITQKKYRDNFRVIRAKWGGHLVADFTKPVMKTWYDALYDNRGPWMALALIRHMSIMFSHTEMRGWRPEGSNPCQKLKMEVPKGRRRTASWDDFDALVAAADAAGLRSVGDAITISTLVGQRRTDILEARRELFRETSIDMPGAADPVRLWVWQLTRSKRGNETILPLHREVVARILPRLTALSEGPLLIDERAGKAFPANGDLFHDRFQEIRAAAIKAGAVSIKGLQFRDLRRTFGSLSRAGGADKADVGDVLGNSAATNQQLGDIYMAPEILSVLRAVGAIQRPDQTGRKSA